jgi:methyltransferase (TIGR00027 family)
MSTTKISDVSDTALWVAVYRAKETERPDALFQDPLAKRLAGNKGEQIAVSMGFMRYVSWSVVIRTCIIDTFIRELVAGGVDTVVNLGAGLDTRPYRLNLPANLRWVEVDFPHMIELKNEKLAGEKPHFQMERVALDLSNDQARLDFLKSINDSSKSVLVLTEGVIPYLTPEQVARLAQDLRAQKNIHFWIADYYAPEIKRYTLDKKKVRQMENAPFQFLPDDWFGFFEKLNWTARETRYLVAESERLGREIPTPWWAKIIRFFAPKKLRQILDRMMGYVLLVPK